MSWLNGFPWITARNAVPVALVDANGSPYDTALSSGGYSSSATFTPTNTAYAAGDNIGAAQAFANAGPALGGEVLILATRLLIPHTALIASEAGYDLHLYGVTPPSAPADNAAWDLPAADRASYLGKIALGTPVDVGSTLLVDQTAINKPVTVPVGGSLYGVLVTSAGFTPTAVGRIVTLKTAAL